MDKYCRNCKRIVGTRKNITPGVIVLIIGFLLALFLPFIGIIGIPIIPIGLLIIILGGRSCAICGSKSLSDKNPE